MRIRCCHLTTRTLVPLAQSFLHVCVVCGLDAVGQRREVHIGRGALQKQTHQIQTLQVHRIVQARLAFEIGYIRIGAFTSNENENQMVKKNLENKKRNKIDLKENVYAWISNVTNFDRETQI